MPGGPNSIIDDGASTPNTRDGALAAVLPQAAHDPAARREARRRAVGIGNVEG